MSYEAYWSGALGTILGTLLGAWFAYRFQKKLLQQQLDFQKEQAEQDALQRKDIAMRQAEALNQMNSAFFQIRLSAEACAVALEGANRLLQRQEMKR